MYGQAYERAANFLRSIPSATDALARLHLEHRFLDDAEREIDTIHQRQFDLTGRKERILADLTALDQRRPAAQNSEVRSWDARERSRLEAELEAVKSEISRLSGRRSAIAVRGRAFKQRTETMKRYINSTFSTNTKLDFNPIEPLATAHLAVAFAEAREQTNQLATAREEIERAPQTLAETRAAVAAEVAALAERGKPFLTHTFERGPIRWGTEFVSSDLDAGVAGGEFSPSAVEVVNAAALVCWAMKDTILKKLNTELEALADDKHAMSAADKAKALAANAIALLKAQREEEALAFACLKEGIDTIELRPDASAEAMLGIAA